MQPTSAQPLRRLDVAKAGLVPSGNHPGVTARDHLVLADLATYRYLTVAQIARLRFGHHKLAQRRLRRLYALRLVDRFQPDPAPRLGFREWTYRLSPAGAQLVARDLGNRSDAVKPPFRPPRGDDYLAHHRELTDVRIWLAQACQASAGAFELSFIPAYEEVSYAGHRRRRVALEGSPGQHTVIPDGIFSLQRRDGRAALFMLEVDRGSEPLAGRHHNAITGKLMRYRKGFEGRAETAFVALFGHEFDGFRVLFVVPDERRARAVLRLAVKVELDPLVWVALRSSLQPAADLFATIWQDRPGGDCRALAE